ncbi:MAG: hypothetical protein M3O30_17845 [Planctomycetota bacterium]|nr:hypothetical protein [Planctomycetota bacterium]
MNQIQRIGKAKRRTRSTRRKLAEQIAADLFTNETGSQIELLILVYVEQAVRMRANRYSRATMARRIERVLWKSGIEFQD